MRQQLSSSSTGPPHGVDESRVDSYERRTRYEVNENHSEPVVYVEVDVLVPEYLQRRCTIDINIISLQSASSNAVQP